MLKLQRESIPRTHVVVQLGGSIHIFRQAMDSCFEGKCVFRIYKSTKMYAVIEMAFGGVSKFWETLVSLSYCLVVGGCAKYLVTHLE